MPWAAIGSPGYLPVARSASGLAARNRLIGMNKLSGIHLLTHPIQDIAQAILLYGQLLGVEPYVDTPYSVGYKLGDHEIGLVPNGQRPGMAGPPIYFDVSDIRGALKSLVDAEAQIQQDVRNVGGGLLVATLKDRDGNITGLRQFPAEN
jgi:predicted enzyme related to lactoylglutathione lyase